jgi:hypothetical protein
VTPKQVAAITVPTLGIVGTMDPSLPQFRELIKLRPTMKLVTVDGATHGGPKGLLGRPEFVAAVRELIASHSASRPR